MDDGDIMIENDSQRDFAVEQLLDLPYGFLQGMHHARSIPRGHHRATTTTSPGPVVNRGRNDRAIL
jgi:hypothetical protein